MGNLKGHVASTVPVGRLGEPEEFANLATYMTSDYSSWMTGSVSQPYSQH